MWTTRQKRTLGAAQVVVGVTILGVTLLREGRDPVLMAMLSVLVVVMGVVTLWRNSQQGR